MSWLQFTIFTIAMCNALFILGLLKVWSENRDD